jgi:Rrf2 family iron-sulfur cluster assembly transcriptional regulator
MIELAKHEESGSIPLRSISIRQNISLSYLESMFSLLRQRDLVTSSRGPGGGYSLGRSACLITIADIMDALNELPYMHPTGDRDQSFHCLATNELWNSMNANALEFLRSVRLNDLVPKGPIPLEDSPPQSRKNHGVRSKVVQPTVLQNIPNSVFALGQIDSSRA